MRVLRRSFLLCAFALAALGQDSFQDVSRVVAIGDIHGDIDQLVTVLRSAELINNKNKWIGGKTHLVQTGDMLDRGPASRKVLDLLMSLEEQARKAGGEVHALLGNHECMNLYGDLRYVSKEDYESFRGDNSEQLRDQYFQLMLDQRKKAGQGGDEEAFRKTFYTEHPLGWVEHLQAFAPNGVYGKWLRQLKAVIRVNDAIFLHGGISPKYVGLSIEEINAKVHSELADFKNLPNGIVMDNEGPLWYRGFAQLPEMDLTAHVDQVLTAQHVHHIVVGHTPGVAILPRFGGKVIAIDVGLSKVYGGPPAVLIIEGSKYYALHRGQRLELPVDGGSVIPYLKAAAALDPPPSAILPLITKLEAH